MLDEARGGRRGAHHAKRQGGASYGCHAATDRAACEERREPAGDASVRNAVTGGDAGPADNFMLERGHIKGSSIYMLIG